MSATDVHEGFWPNVAATNPQPAAIEAGEQPLALEAAPQPIALEAAPTIAAIEVGSAPNDLPEEPEAEQETAAPAVESTLTPLEAAVAAADEQAEAAVAEATAVVEEEDAIVAVASAPVDLPPVELVDQTDITALAAELDAEQRVAMEDVIDFADFGADPIDTGIEATQLHHLPMVEQATLGGGNLDAVRATQPRTLAAHRELEAAVMTGTETVTEFDRTLIGLIVAIENRSGYWQVHLRRRLQRWCTAEEVDALAQDWTRTDLAVRERAMLAFSVKLTLVPGQMTEQDAQLLSNVGLSERDLLDVVDVIAYWSFATRVAEGLGVFVEPWLADEAAAS